jgi:hypothetical protein
MVIDVAISSAETIQQETIQHGDLAVRIVHLNEMDVQRLLEPPSGDATSGDDEGNKKPKTPPSPPATPTKKSERQESGRRERQGSARPNEGTADSDGASWPPNENVFGLIGQHSAATKLQNKVDLAGGTGRRFTDTLFIGSAGVGKSSLCQSRLR